MKGFDPSFDYIPLFSGLNPGTGMNSQPHDLLVLNTPHVPVMNIMDVF